MHSSFYNRPPIAFPLFSSQLLLHQPHHQGRLASRGLSLFRRGRDIYNRISYLIAHTSHSNQIHVCSPNLANARGGVPNASRMRMGRSGFFALTPRYDFSMNALHEDRRETNRTGEQESVRLFLVSYPESTCFFCTRPARWNQSCFNKLTEHRRMAVTAGSTVSVAPSA
jgi:hypothetical protein